MESRTSNLTAEICRRGDYTLRYGRAALYENAKHVPSLKPTLVRIGPDSSLPPFQVRHPQYFLVVNGQICVKYPEDKGYIMFDDSSRYFDPEFRFRRI